MAGLLSKQPQGAPPQQGAPATAGPGGEESNVSPEEQQQYETFVTNGEALIYNEKAMPELLQAIKGDGNPVEGLANALVTIVTRLDDSARQAGQEISGDVKYHAAEELLDLIVELAEEGGAHKFTDEEVEAALFQAMDLYRDAAQAKGTLPQQELEQDFGELMAADQAGSIDQIVPGLSEYAQRGQRPGGGMPAPQGGMGGPGRRPA